jgi:leucyl aminopeptidase
MDVTIRRADCTEFETPLLALHLFEGAAVPEGPAAKVDEAMGGRISALIEAGDFRGKEGETLLLFPEGRSRRSGCSWSGSASARSWTASGCGARPRWR